MEFRELGKTGIRVSPKSVWVVGGSVGHPSGGAVLQAGPERKLINLSRRSDEPGSWE